MTKLAGAIIIALAFLLSACSYRDGIYAVVRADAAAQLSAEFSAWLASRGFEREHPQPSDGFFAIRRASEDQKIGLVASVHFYDGKHSLFIGKWNTRKFSADEIAVVDECALWLASHSDAIERGTASKSSTTEAGRAKFYAKIKKA